MEMGRGGAYVPARVALQGRIHRSSPAHDAYVFGYGNAAARTFGRAHRHRPYAFCLRKLRVDVRPYGFVWTDCAWAPPLHISFGQIAYGCRMVFLLDE